MSAKARPDVNAVSVEAEPDHGTPSGFQARYRQLGPLLGAELLGGTLYEFDPGERTGPYHYEIGNEECLLVLTGNPTLRHPEGGTCSRWGRWSCFPKASTARIS